MRFGMAQDVREYFGNIMNPGGSQGSEDKSKFIMFDPYYCCALIGMAACEIDTDESGSTSYFAQEYPGPYRDNKAYIAGLLVASEVKRRYQDIDVRAIKSETLEKIMLEYLTSENDILLTDKGISTLNAYSRQGARIYQEMFSPPTTREEFLLGFYTIMKLYGN